MRMDTDAPRPVCELEFWFELASNYSYLSVMRIEAAAGRSNVRVAWKPFLLGPIFKDLGMATSPFVLQKEKGAYMWQDMARQCRKYGLQWGQPTIFPRSSLLATRVAILGVDQPWIGAYCRRVMERNFALDQDFDDPDQLAEVLTAIGLPASDLLTEASTETTKIRLRSQTKEARDRGIFGAPTFFVGDQMFWGNDRLEDAFDAALAPKPGGFLADSPKPT